MSCADTHKINLICPLMYSHRNLLLHSIRNILPYTTLLSSSNSVLFCSHPFWHPTEFFILVSFQRVFGGPLILSVLVLTVLEPWTDLQISSSQEQFGNCSKIWLCNSQSHAKISSIVMQELLMRLLTPHILFHPHSSMGDIHCMWYACIVK